MERERETHTHIYIDKLYVCVDAVVNRHMHLYMRVRTHTLWKGMHQTILTPAMDK